MIVPMSEERANLLSIPCELRNIIYCHLFDLNATETPPIIANATHSIAEGLMPALDLSGTRQCRDTLTITPSSCDRLRILQTCRQIHEEAHLLALSCTPFHISGDCSYPDLFSLRSRPLRLNKISAIRHLTLTAKISHLRAMNEQWNGLPFGNEALHLDTLTIVPKRPDASTSCYAEVADLSQSHTLAYIFAESLKALKNVGTMIVRNDACFNQVVWRLLYRSLIYRMWRWGGNNCGVRFSCSPEGPDEQFNAYLCGTGGNECGAEVMRLVGRDGQIPGEAELARM